MPEERKRYRRKYNPVDQIPLDQELAKLKLSQKLNFCQIVKMPSAPAPGIFSNSSEGKTISRKLVHLLRHDLPGSGLQFSDDGAVRVKDVIEKWKNEGFECTEEKIVASSHKDFGGGKVRYVIGEMTGFGSFIGAIGGHSFPVSNPLGTDPLSDHAATQIKFAYHATTATTKITSSGFISQMQRTGGINCFYKTQNELPHAYETNTSGFKIDLVEAMKFGIVFQHNRFSDIIFCLGKWDESKGMFDGKLPIEIKKGKTKVNLAMLCNFVNE